MKFSSPLFEGVLIKRYKRFLADVELASGEIITAHTANTGSMKGCSDPGSRVWLSVSDNPSRKYPFSWEIVQVNNTLVGINTGLPNKLVAEAIVNGIVTELQGFETIRTEVKYGLENSRIDLLLEKEDTPPCYVEVKNVTLVDNAIACFPDAVSKRGTKHLRELMQMVNEGYRAVIFYCIQRNDTRAFRPADHIDPEYSDSLRDAVKKGVEALAYEATVTRSDITLCKPVPVVLK